VLVATIWVIASSILTLRVLRSGNWYFNRKSEDSDEVTAGPMPFKVRTLFTIAKILIVFGVLFFFVGYLNLGIYVISRTIVTLGIITIALLAHGVVREGIRQATSEQNPFGAWVRKRLAIQDAGADRWTFWIVLLFDTVLFIALVLFLLNVWGLPWTEIRPALLVLIYGTEIGGHTFSLVNVGLALGTFVLLMLVVRLLQGVLSNRILVQTRLDIGVRDAVTAGVGYVGVVVAVLFALSLIGFNFGDVALIFGALSIGIGFGLQHVVNNFISGLILLVQRPIKAGDWIVVGPGSEASEGYVKRINVISTEITTFDNATIIVPNNQLMTMEVMNWTHRGRLGRAKVPIGVSYSADPEEVKQILLQCARQNNSVLSRPAPNVIFKNFGESSLDFELRVFIRDIDYVFNVASELRFAIKKALDEAGIEIPFPQRDVHVKSMLRGAGDLPA
jgi:small-conductance mechanosensitive channel